MKILKTILKKNKYSISKSDRLILAFPDIEELKNIKCNILLFV